MEKLRFTKNSPLLICHKSSVFIFDILKCLIDSIARDNELRKSRGVKLLWRHTVHISYMIFMWWLKKIWWS